MQRYRVLGALSLVVSTSAACTTRDASAPGDGGSSDGPALVRDAGVSPTVDVAGPGEAGLPSGPCRYGVTPRRLLEPPKGADDPVFAWTGVEYGLLWRDYRDTLPGENTRSELYFQRLSRQGVLQGSAMRVTTGTGFGATAPRLVWNGASYVAVYARDGKFHRLVLDAQGTPQGDPTPLVGGREAKLAVAGSTVGLAWMTAPDVLEKPADCPTCFYRAQEIWFAVLPATGSFTPPTAPLDSARWAVHPAEPGSDYFRRSHLLARDAGFSLAWFRQVERQPSQLRQVVLDARGSPTRTRDLALPGVTSFRHAWDGRDLAVLYRAEEKLPVKLHLAPAGGPEVDTSIGEGAVQDLFFGPDGLDLFWIDVKHPMPVTLSRRSTTGALRPLFEGPESGYPVDERFRILPVDGGYAFLWYGAPTPKSKTDFQPAALWFFTLECSP
ncbi:MAG: hypothetical protein IT371_16630 [Deltaproteobacteria bacterium]|nr:hypothetical protein [Deltaproteobacteria bacterium]